MASGTKPRGNGRGRKTPANARAEKKAVERKIEFEGLELNLPEQLPGTMLFDWVSVAEEGGNPFVYLRMIHSIIGPIQFAQLRDSGVLEVETDSGNVAVSVDKTAELMKLITEEFGLGEGESSAS